MKKLFITTGILLIMVCGVMAFATFDFPGWAMLEQKSKDIIIARCKTTPTASPVNKDGVEQDLRGLIESEMELVSLLKGTTNFGTVHLRSGYWPRQGEYYLIFANYSGGLYQAFETYKVVPLGVQFEPGSLAGKRLDDQIQLLLRQRLNTVNRQISDAVEEQQRLKEKFKN